MASSVRLHTLYREPPKLEDAHCVLDNAIRTASFNTHLRLGRKTQRCRSTSWSVALLVCATVLCDTV
eukprot:5364605-Pyramimonas_sp.AAC.2